MADVTEKSLDDFFAKRDKKKKKEKTKTKEAIPVPAATVLVKKIKKEKEKSAKNENPDAPVEKVTRPGRTRTGVTSLGSPRLMFPALNRPEGSTRVGSRGADTPQVSPRCVEPLRARPAGRGPRWVSSGVSRPRVVGGGSGLRPRRYCARIWALTASVKLHIHYFIVEGCDMSFKHDV